MMSFGKLLLPLSRPFRVPHAAGERSSFNVSSWRPVLTTSARRRGTAVSARRRPLKGNSGSPTPGPRAQHGTRKAKRVQTVWLSGITPTGFLRYRPGEGFRPQSFLCKFSGRPERSHRRPGTRLTGATGSTPARNRTGKQTSHSALTFAAGGLGPGRERRPPRGGRIPGGRRAAPRAPDPAPCWPRGTRPPLGDNDVRPARRHAPRFSSSRYRTRSSSSVFTSEL